MAVEALRAQITDALQSTDIELAEQLMETCYRMYSDQPTGLAPEIAELREGTSRVAADSGARHNLLRPETVESLFVLWWVTGDEKYRDWGWHIFVAFERLCRLQDGGYSGLKDVTDRHGGGHNGKMESFFLAETLKYLYLLFSDRDYYPLEDWVFTTEAHLISARPRCDDGSCFGSADRGPLFALPLDLLLLLAGGAALALLRRRRRPRLRRDS